MSLLTQQINQYAIQSGLLSNGTMSFFDLDTQTPKIIYQDGDETIPFGTVVVLDNNGFAPDIFFTGAAKVIIKDKNGVQILERDLLTTFDSGLFGTWISTKTYGKGGSNIVTGSDNLYYLSIDIDNLGHDPVSSPEWWENIEFTRNYNEFVTYDINDWVKKDNFYYRSIQVVNLGNDPVTSPEWWEKTEPIHRYNEFVTYNTDDWVKEGGFLYSSLIDSNLGNLPSTSPTEWELTIPPSITDWELIQDIDVTVAVASIEFTDLDLDQYNHYRIQIIGGLGGSIIPLKSSLDNGATYMTGITFYQGSPTVGNNYLGEIPVGTNGWLSPISFSETFIFNLKDINLESFSYTPQAFKNTAVASFLPDVIPASGAMRLAKTVETAIQLSSTLYPGTRVLFYGMT